ncbi:hypothetical protein AB0G02_13390 [Actinosynnema sp. NPDC023658]|uniref:dTMP kinase n=1 Tax=Actinosynnema sp. NPDC023658 TaxID=3155465 RepID=UPI0033F294E9
MAVEGMECSGKTTVVETCARALNDASVSTAVVGEFSESPLGDYLHARLSRDRFLRDPDRPRTAWTQAFAVAADTAFAFEYTIADLRASHQVVLKDRYRESLVACQHTALADEYAMTDDEAHQLLADVAAKLPDVADLVIWLDVPEHERYARLRARGDFMEGDQGILARREIAYRKLLGAADWPGGHEVVDGAGSSEEVMGRVLRLIEQKLTGTN